MRTTIRMDDDLLAQARRVAAESGRTLTALIETAVRELITRRESLQRREPVELPVFTGRGLRPGVDLDSTAALLDLMDEDGGDAAA